MASAFDVQGWQPIHHPYNNGTSVNCFKHQKQVAHVKGNCTNWLLVICSRYELLGQSMFRAGRLWISSTCGLVLLYHSFLKCISLSWCCILILHFMITCFMLHMNKNREVSCELLFAQLTCTGLSSRSKLTVRHVHMRGKYTILKTIIVN